MLIAFDGVLPVNVDVCSIKIPLKNLNSTCFGGVSYLAVFLITFR
jgi:hypothetical protein